MWHENRDEFIAEFRKSKSQRQLAADKTVSRGLIRRRFERWGLDPNELLYQPSGEEQTQRKLRQKNLQLSEENRALKKELKILDKNSNVIGAISDSILPYVQGLQLPKMKKPPLIKGSGKGISQLLSLNDWHYGDIVRPEQVNGLNSYSTNIACRRVEKVVNATIRLGHDHATTGNPVEELVVVLNGDQFSGMHNIHPDDALEDGRIARQLVDCALLTAQAIWELAAHYSKVRVVCPAGDNHTRSTRRTPTSATALEQSWSSPYHEIISLMLMQLEHVTMEIHPSYQAFFRIQGWEWSACHGHGIKGGGGNLGFPAYGVSKHHAGNLAKTVMLAKMLKQKKDATFDDFVAALSGIVDHTLVGHFHTKLTFEHLGGEVHISPSLKGHDTFTGDILSKVGKSGQTLWCIHPKNDIMCTHPINTQTIVDEGDTRYMTGALTGLQTSGEIWQRWLHQNS